MRRAAIVIGVNRTASLAPLTGAASDALRFGQWLSTQGFETTNFVDRLENLTEKVVHFRDIFDQIEKIIASKIYEQLVIYFAGHGFQSGGSEIWLLSEAPRNGSEAIGLEASILAARESGLSSVVFVSDACRSIPKTLQESRIDGGSIFPNADVARATRADIDRFFATLPSLVAVAAENADDKARRYGIYTTEFLNAYRNTADNFVFKVTENGTSFEVVTNRNLKKLLQVPVEDAAADAMPKAGQVSDAIVESDDAYVGRVLRDPERTERPHVPVISVAEAVRDMILAAPGPDVIGWDAKPQAGKESAAIGASIGLPQATDVLMAQPAIDRFESGTGFTITGAEVSGVISPTLHVEHLDGKSIRVWPKDLRDAGSVIGQFSDKAGFIVPSLPGYIGHIQVQGGSITNINYLPSANTERWRQTRHVLEPLQRMRAMVAAASRLGLFRVTRDKAGLLADTIRELKGADPSLGVYAAYAYSSAGLSEQVDSVREAMFLDLGVDLFDVAMLSRGRAEVERVFPPCPMLRQGWALLAVTRTSILPIIQEARKWLLPGLWTTFAPEGAALLIDAATRREFK